MVRRRGWRGDGKEERVEGYVCGWVDVAYAVKPLLIYQICK